MPFFISEYIGSGLSPRDAFRPALSEQVAGCSAIDLRSDGGATLDGGGLNAALVYCPLDLVGAKWEKIGEGDKKEKLSKAAAKRIFDKLKINVKDIEYFDELIADLLLSPPENAWKGLTLTHGMKYEILLGPKNDPLLWSMPLISGGALPATDAFTAGDGTALTTYSASWSYNNGVFAINTNSVYSNTAGGDPVANWNADAFENNQYAQGTLVALTGTGQIGVAVRLSTSEAHTGYFYYSSSLSAGRQFYKVVTGSYTQLGNDSTVASSVNDALRFEANGTTITPKKNGSVDSNVGGSVTDTAITSGSAGISGSNNQSGSRLDSWEGGNIVLPPHRDMTIYQAVARASFH